jgi:hypothetical protein
MVLESLLHLYQNTKFEETKNFIKKFTSTEMSNHKPHFAFQMQQMDQSEL